MGSEDKSIEPTDSRDSNETTMSTSFWRWRRPFNSNRSVNTQQSQQVRSGTASEALRSLFGDEELSDVKLKGSDGGEVLAVKALLAARSPVFRSSLYAPMVTRDAVFSSTGKPIVEFPEWDCRILHLTVEFCYTDELSIMSVEPSDDIARIMAGLRSASKVFKLPTLLDKVKQWSWRNVNRHPALACAMVDEGMKYDDIDDVAIQTIQLKTRSALLPGSGGVGAGVLALTKPGLLLILRTLEDSTSHLLLFQSIQRWVDFSPEDSIYNNDDRNKDAHTVRREKSSREAFARKCAMRFIKLSKIQPGALEQVMKDSALFRSDQSLALSSESSLMDAGLQFSQ
jgi:hypothetical protein